MRRFTRWAPWSDDPQHFDPTRRYTVDRDLCSAPTELEVVFRSDSNGCGLYKPGSKVWLDVGDVANSRISYITPKITVPAVTGPVCTSPCSC